MPDHKGFKAELTQLLNKYSLEGGSDTPDFLLADYLVQCLAVFDVTIAHREAWYGRPLATKAVTTPESVCAWCGAAGPSTYPVTQDGRTAYCCTALHQQELLRALT